MTLKGGSNYTISLKETQIPQNRRSLLVIYIQEKNEIKIHSLYTIFSFEVAINIIKNDENPELKVVDECR